MKIQMTTLKHKGYSYLMLIDTLKLNKGVFKLEHETGNLVLSKMIRVKMLTSNFENLCLKHIYDTFRYSKHKNLFDNYKKK